MRTVSILNVNLDKCIIYSKLETKDFLTSFDYLSKSYLFWKIMFYFTSLNYAQIN